MRAAVLLTSILALIVCVYVTWAWRSPIASVEISSPQSGDYDELTVRRGAELAAIGNCVQCHTAPEGKPYAGGRAVPTPFGLVWGTNITPDLDTGIGYYSKEAFERAMREGVDRHGRHLYPAFPYDHMRIATVGDIDAVWAFLMTRTPVQQINQTTRLAFPLNQRLLLAGWKALFLREQAFNPSPERSAQWNRGAYLVEGLAHCGACHTPRNIFGAEIASAAYSGALVDAWYAPALDANSPAAVPWTAEAIYSYLRFGRDDKHGAAAGPMNDVAHSLAGINASDVAAIAAYVADIAGHATPERTAAAERAAVARAKVAAPTSPAHPGAVIYAGACAPCHGQAGRVPSNPAINLALSSSVRADDPTNFFNVLRGGIGQPDGIAGPFMPGFADILTPGQIEDLAAFVRNSFAGKPNWAARSTSK